MRIKPGVKKVLLNFERPSLNLKDKSFIDSLIHKTLQRKFGMFAVMATDDLKDLN